MILMKQFFQKWFDKNEMGIFCDKNIETSSEISLIPFSLYDYCIDLIQRKFECNIIYLHSIYFDSASYIPNDA